MNSTKQANKVNAPLDASTSEETFAAFVEAICAHPENQLKQLVALLARRHPIYQARTANEINKMRGYLMAAFEQTGLPQGALPYVLEALESAFHPYVVAGAAKALRGIAQPHPQNAAYLVKAIFNIWQNDQPMSFASYEVKWPLKDYTTGLSEIFETLGQMGAYAQKVLPDLERLYHDLSSHLSEQNHLKLKATIETIQHDPREVDTSCCAPPVVFKQTLSATATQSIKDVLIEDQATQQLTWSDFFEGNFTVLAFFYTRCHNPRRCTLTIQHMVEIQRLLKQEGLFDEVKTAAISYDPKYDTAGALAAYGNARNFNFDKNHRMFRIPTKFEQVMQTLQLGVNFTGSVVNHHQIEWFVLDPQGQVVNSYVQVQAQPNQIVDQIKNLLQANQNEPTKGKMNSAFSIVLPIIVAFFPKCLACWASYLSVFGLTSLASVTYQPWLLPVIAAMLAFNLVVLYRKAKKRNGLAPFAFSCIGTGFMLTMNIAESTSQQLLIPGLAMLLMGSLLNSLDYHTFNKLKLFVFSLRYRLN